MTRTVHHDPLHRRWHREQEDLSLEGRLIWVCLDCANVRGRC